MGISASVDNLEEWLIKFAELIAALIEESQQLCCLLNASVKTAKKENSISPGVFRSLKALTK